MSDQPLQNDTSLPQRSTSEQFTRLFLQHQDRLHGYIYALVLNRFDADDILQDVAVVMCRKFDEYQQETSFVAWGMKIAKNIIWNYRRKQKRSMVKFNEEALAQIATDLENMVDALAIDRKDAFRNCFEKIDPSEKELIELRYDSGLTVKKIAESKMISPRLLYHTYYRIINSLRLCINQTIAKWEGGHGI